MSTAVDKRGLKRVCADCGIRFYDLNKRPILCPNCKTEFTGIEKIKTRRGRTPTEKEEKIVGKNVASDTIEIESEENIISLDDLEESENELDTDGDDLDAGIDLDDDMDDLDVDLDDAVEEDISKD